MLTFRITHEESGGRAPEVDAADARQQAHFPDDGRGHVDQGLVALCGGKKPLRAGSQMP